MFKLLNQEVHAQVDTDVHGSWRPFAKCIEGSSVYTATNRHHRFSRVRGFWESSIKKP